MVVKRDTLVKFHERFYNALDEISDILSHDTVDKLEEVIDDFEEFIGELDDDPEQTPAQDKGLKVGDRVKLRIHENYDFQKGDIIEFVSDDGTICPEFKNADGETRYFYLTDIEPIECVFKVGDIVKIREDSEYSGQCNYDGKIQSISGVWYRVEFVNGYRNRYKLCDLNKVE